MPQRNACRSDPHIKRRWRLKADVGAFEPREHLRNVAAGYGLERTPGLQKAVGPVGYPRPDALALYAQLVQVETSGIASGRETPGEPQQRVVVMCYGLEYVQGWHVRYDSRQEPKVPPLAENSSEPPQ